MFVYQDPDVNFVQAHTFTLLWDHVAVVLALYKCIALVVATLRPLSLWLT